MTVDAAEATYLQSSKVISWTSKCISVHFLQLTFLKSKQTNIIVLMLIIIMWFRTMH